jgi:SpoVK/Ycf46/Vps4 family AAA+-type ATPase
VFDFKDIVGQDEAWKHIKSVFLDPVDNDALSRVLQLTNKIPAASKGLLLSGPPGSGKTTIAKAIAHVTNIPMFNVGAQDLLDKWQGIQEHKLAAVFRAAAQQKRAIIFIDEIDKIFGEKPNGDNNHGLRQVLLTAMDVRHDRTWRVCNCFGELVLHFCLFAGHEFACQRVGRRCHQQTRCTRSCHSSPIRS